MRLENRFADHHAFRDFLAAPDVLSVFPMRSSAGKHSGNGERQSLFGQAEALLIDHVDLAGG